jgi:hypothetical protein
MQSNQKTHSREFVDSIDRVAKSEQLGAEWAVYRDFEIEEKGDEVYVYALRRPETLEVKPGTVLNTFPKDLNLDRRYAPLREEPSLFLKFASLARKGPFTRDKALEVMLDWIKSYGTLGWGSTYYLNAPGSVPQETHRRECWSAFERAMTEAARCLGLYEAARAPDSAGTDVALQHYGIFGPTPEVRREMALQTVGELVGGHVRNECYPVLYREFNKDTEQTVGFSIGWDFHSLLGAMYLQMAWLMDKGISIRSCKGPGCPFFISYDESRRDKEFCSKNCKEKWRYHHVVKPKRQGQAI